MNLKTLKPLSLTIISSFVLLSSVLSFAQQDQLMTSEKAGQAYKTAIFAGGCFWCTESDFEKKKGIIKAESGYTGGRTKNPNYKQVTKNNTGHYEAVKVTYDPEQVTFTNLVDFFWRTIDPTDPHGQFCDKGESYRSAIFYDNATEKDIIDSSLKTLKANKPFTQPIVTEILPTARFYLAEDYHQDYYKKNPVRYNFYRLTCGRDQRLEELWQSQ